MVKVFGKSRKIGLPPGTLVHIGERKVEEVAIRIFAYDQHNLTEKTVTEVSECFPYKDSDQVVWINIAGLHRLELIEEIGRYFGIHPLVLEDVVNTSQRTKLEEFDDYLYLVVKMLYYDEQEDEVWEEQLSLVLGAGILITFQERSGDIFDSIRERLRGGKTRITRKNADYLLYSLIDAVVDNYYVVIEKISDELEWLDEQIFIGPSMDFLQSIHSLKRNLIEARKSMLQLREVVAVINKQEFILIDESSDIYFRDIYDHLIHVVETVDTYRDVVAGMSDTFLTIMSNKMNEVMKILTMIATIFIPLTFIAGIYGMNFVHMPELTWRWGYFAVLTVMTALAGGMLLYFRRKRWW